MIVQLHSPSLRLYESALMRTVTSLVVGDEYLLLVDPNWLPQEVEYIHFEAEALREGRKCYLLFTHSDYDHITGYGKFPGYTTLASAAFVNSPQGEETMEQIRAFDDEYYLSRDYPLSYPTIDLPIAGDGVEQKIGEDAYAFYQAPGHNADGLITLNRSRGILIVGDYLSNVEFPFVYHSFADYRETLDKLAHLIATEPIKVLVTGHGDHTSDRTEMLHRIEESRGYLNEVESCVRDDRSFDAQPLFQRYGFPRVMKKYHQANLELARQSVR
ncbi:glyoxylase-like metal-dependent hydrolase (beta-lactamase superfamily II) [Lewinella aquimaris]|uniref:Glyoxylase-like metal-dependent hydrolase (Beta-lactamase superfamily II) n=1 Tax=Neolewinella aquimaris TaxID=1835722 RepID=A0A840E4P9_9BACT|nr:MBL fold metallo-hydrolase [Neolewinella aquimaris]MBB4078635.1 glyoxylase-like metal-dependent hydrolase (beta-lactamase superfamily II) [Neolewinella aquimaris]